MLEARTVYQGDTPTWYAAHDLDGNGTLADLSVGYTCQIKVVGSAVDRAVTTLDTATGYVNKRFVCTLTEAETRSLSVGSHIVALQIANAAIGFAAEDQGILTIAAEAIGGTGGPDLATMEMNALQTARDDIWNAILALGRGERVKEVWRDGRRIVRESASLKDLNALLDVIDRQIAATTAVAAGRPRRRAIAIGWPV